MAAVRALRSLGDAAAVPALERLASRRFADSRLRRAARAAAKGLGEAEAKKGAPPSDRVERLENELVKLKERLAAVEAGKAGGGDAKPARAAAAKKPAKPRKKPAP
jgi:HEAT repeat protein